MATPVFVQVTSERIGERERDGSHGVYNLIPEVTSSYFCHIPFIRSHSLGPAYSQREGSTQGVNPGRKNVGGVISESASALALGPMFSANLADRKFRLLAEK